MGRTEWIKRFQYGFGLQIKMHYEHTVIKCGTGFDTDKESPSKAQR